MRRRAWAERVVDANAENYVQVRQRWRALLTQANAMDKLQGPMPLGEGVPRAEHHLKLLAAGLRSTGMSIGSSIQFQAADIGDAVRWCGRGIASVHVCCWRTNSNVIIRRCKHGSADVSAASAGSAAALFQCAVAALLAMLQPNVTDSRGGGPQPAAAMMTVVRWTWRRNR